MTVDPPGRWHRFTIAPWIVSLLISGALTLLLVLGTHPHRHYRVSARVIAGVLIWLGLATIFRFLVYVVDRGRGPT